MGIDESTKRHAFASRLHINRWILPSASALPPETCTCLGRITDDDFSVYVRRSVEPSDAGLPLTAVIPALPKFSPVQTTFDIGTLPGAASGNMTYSVDEGDRRPLTSIQNITACRHVPVEPTVCAPDAQPGSVLRLTEKHQTMLSSQSCVHIIEKFSFQGVDSYRLVFSYDEGAGCPFQENFVFHVYNDQQPCLPKTTTTTATTAAPFVTTRVTPPPSVSTTTTTPTSTTSPPCRHTATSLPRQPATLDNGLRVLCDTETDGGNWILIQRRTRGDVDFYRDWSQYVAGFGNITGDFWMGLQDIHTICPPSKPCDLRVDIRDDQLNNGQLYSAQYTRFSLSGFTDNYQLHIYGIYNGTAGDALRLSKGYPFSTYDRDNDRHRLNCAEYSHGGWWYAGCTFSNLNGAWGHRGTSGRHEDGLAWHDYLIDSSPKLYATFSEMKVRMQ